MRIFGIDPGSRKCGWGAIERHGSRVSHIASGTLQLRDEALLPRLVALYRGLSQAIRETGPQAVAVEMVFHAKNSQSALVLGHARGVALVAAGEAGLPVAEYSAGQIKQAVSGYGRADKAQVQHMVRLLLRLPSRAMGADESDALAAALCYGQAREPCAAPLALRQSTGLGGEK